MKKRFYNGVFWDSDDLIACKQACQILFKKGVSEEILSQLDFGNLDVSEVLNEIR